jgi:phosphopantothenate-cysteine ligase
MDEQLLTRLHNFTTRHTSHHRPITLVTSGGTAADLEVNAVRFLDNFSTGLRGACAVEQFLKRGYAVIHLKRAGSVSPFGRLVEDAVGGGGRMGFESIGELFDCGDGSVVDIDGDFDLKSDDVNSNKAKSERNESSDPWLYSTERDEANGLGGHSISKSKKTYGELSLNPRLTHSHVLQSAVRSYNNIVQQGLLITVTFRTVDDYLQKLQACCEAINTAGSLGLVYLAAAVSDFYIPHEKKSMHKIQSRDYGLKESESSNTAQIGVDNTLTITMYPVPKVIASLRKEWCPNAFVISFKLETDSAILQKKATMAMEKYDVHLVIGNELQTRYERVFILSREEAGNVINGTLDNESSGKDCNLELPNGFALTEVTSASSTATHGGNKVDALEDATIEYVVRHHFYFISTHMDPAQPNMSSVELFARTTHKAEVQHQARLRASYRELQREKLKCRIVELAWNIGGSALGMAISYGVARMLQQKQHIS